MNHQDILEKQTLKVTEGTYVPDMGIEYPDDPSVRMIHPTNFTHKFEMDENYPYWDESFHYKLNYFLAYCKCWSLVRPMLSVVYGIRIKRNGIMKKYKKELKNGAITICNHCFRLDVPAVIAATRRHFWIPMLGDNMMTDDYWHMKYIGGVPIPSTMAAMKKYNEAFDKHHERGHWFHVFPEGINWNWFKPLKPFQKGAFSMAYKYNMPLLPLYITYRPRTGIYKLFGKKNEPLINISIGEPIFPDTTKPRKTEVDNMREIAFSRMLKMGGIVKNPWDCKPEKDA